VGFLARRPALRENRRLPRAKESFALTIYEPPNFFAKLKRRNVYQDRDSPLSLGWLIDITTP
jgi:hypothetical protein